MEKLPSYPPCVGGIATRYFSNTFLALKDLIPTLVFLLLVAKHYQFFIWALQGLFLLSFFMLRSMRGRKEFLQTQPFF